MLHLERRQEQSTAAGARGVQCQLSNPMVCIPGLQNVQKDDRESYFSLKNSVIIKVIVMSEEMSFKMIHIVMEIKTNQQSETSQKHSSNHRYIFPITV